MSASAYWSGTVKKKVATIHQAMSFLHSRQYQPEDIQFVQYKLYSTNKWFDQVCVYTICVHAELLDPGACATPGHKKKQTK